MQGRTWIVVVAALVGSSFAYAEAQPAVEALTLDVYPRVMQAGGYASVRLRIERDPRSRSLDIAWWSLEGVGGSRRVDIDGDRAAIRHEFPIKHLVPGQYEVSVVLHRDDGTRVKRAATLIVVGR